MLNTEFTCPNGHEFTANAKLRARCPQCGQMARKAFGTVKPKETKPSVSVEHKKVQPKHRAILVKAGRPRLPKVVEKEPLLPKRKTVAKKPAIKTAVTKSKQASIKSTGRAAAGLVKTHRIKGIATPTVRRPPKRTAVARHIQIGRKESFVDRVISRFGPG